MTYLDLYHAALSKIGVVESTESVKDYEERAPYLLASFVSQCASLDKKFRKAHGNTPATISHVAAVTMNDAFPLSDVFLTAASDYLAAMLIMEENEKVSEDLFDRYCDTLACIEAELPAGIEPIVNRYGGLF